MGDFDEFCLLHGLPVTYISDQKAVSLDRLDCLSIFPLLSIARGTISFCSTYLSVTVHWYTPSSVISDDYFYRSSKS